VAGRELEAGKSVMSNSWVLEENQKTTGPVSVEEGR
jgi:hypothetical protein